MPKQSEGEYRVGVSFNISRDSAVDEVKMKAAELIDLVADKGKCPRCTAVAQNAFEEAAMWAVKSITKPPRDK